MSRWVWEQVKQRQPATAKALRQREIKPMFQDQLEVNTAGGVKSESMKETMGK